MTTLTSSSTLTVTAGTPVTETVAVRVLPLGSSIAGTGRMVHPVFGELVYPHSPDKWVNFDTDIIVPPSWGYQATLGSGVNTIHPSSIRDVVVQEIWLGDLSVSIEFLRMLLNFWTQPPAPETGYLLWYPEYVNAIGYKVILGQVTIGGAEVTFDYISRQGWIAGDLLIKMRIVDYA